ncbi:radical SAM protein [candidate division KSB1 bacterium]|nr:radical SAM protein [candidate division KSB1 bacterium]NIR69342.1 radical SAM protein [candidate division KSB1 bacterium]NIS24160.1 radical SAM protein [candidate division KSB1 bacterium]NIT71075.1 radical SAM protein [candidate division KSB1 bacterium]NIU24779.1 radical SAM protein [candidate division KSB1 bacterium]
MIDQETRRACRAAPKTAQARLEREQAKHMYYGLTNALCPTCLQLVRAQILIRDEKVIMRKYCPEHGHSEVLVSSDVDWFTKSINSIKPGERPLSFGTAVNRGCPYDCGLCPDHQQHTCVAQIEVTNYCNLDCPICYAENRATWFLDIERYKFMLREAVKREGVLNQLNLTGGEPTLHPQIVEMVKIARKNRVSMVLINTNGLRLAEDDDFVRQLADARAAIYLSFDGFDPEVYKTIRGEDLLGKKLQALEKLEKYNVPVVLVPAIYKGLNDHEIGPMIKLLTESKNIVTIQLQPLFYVGSCEEEELNPLEKLTLTETIDLVEKGTDGAIKKSDFMYVPCHHPMCGTVCYLLLDEKNNAVPLTRFVDPNLYLDYIKNRPWVDRQELFNLTRGAVEKIASAAAIPDMAGGTVEENIEQIIGLVSDCCATNNTRKFRNRIKQISIHAFMDKYCWDQQRAQKCCVHVILPTGRMISFCNYNNLHRYAGSAITYDNQIGINRMKIRSRQRTNT